NVALQYLNVYERRANLEVARKNYETLQKIYQDGKNRLDVGLIDRNELLKFKVDLDDTLIQVEAAKGGLEKSVILLGRVVGEDLRLALLDFEEFENIPGGKDLEGNMALMLARRSELQVFDKLIEASTYQRQAEQSGYYPKVDLVGSYSYFDDDLIGGRGEVGSEELRAQLILSMNLYRGGATQARVAKARLETQGLHYDMKERKDTLKTELQNLHIDYSVSLRNIDVALVSIEQAEENLRITRLKYNEGLQRESDLLDAVANLSRAQYRYVAVLQNVFSNHFRILRMVEAF
ncbi:MAG TPA: TolC family protein, partial [Desulfopila sp.]|nr:TolC family protein [Desulfopila sp.]